MKKILVLLITFLFVLTLRAQESYEVQVYSSPTTPKNSTIFELHSNLSPNGPNSETNFSHPLHETLEITTGITNNFEIGFYLFDRVNDGKYNYMGSHIRPRFTIPSSWDWYFGTSISLESGFVKDPITNEYEADFEFRPIFDKTIGKNYFSLNPTIDGSFKTHETTFSPNIKYSYNANPKYSLGVEYYGSTGNPLKWDNYNLQSHLFYLVTDLYLDPKYEFQFGVGHGMTESSDQWNIKLIVGNRVNWKK